jgi:hypothetical protein
MNNMNNMNIIINNSLSEIKYIFVYKEFLLQKLKNNRKIETKKADVSFHTICGDDCICGNNYQKLLDNNCINLKNLKKMK